MTGSPSVVSDAKSGDCLYEYTEEHASSIDQSNEIGIDYGCYNIRRFGSTFYSHESELCVDFSRGRDKELEVIMCENFSFLPNGAFHASSIHSNLTPTPKDGYKDSLSVSVGTCSKL